jgi:hypothetical protein
MTMTHTDNKEDKMKYAIERENGMWWTGTCWGVMQAREEYASLDDIPEIIEDDDEDLLLSRYTEIGATPTFDLRYYPDSYVDEDAVASVVEV